MRAVTVSPFPLAHNTISPVALDPARGLFFEPADVSLPPLVRMAVRSHPWTLRDGWIGEFVRLVVSPIDEHELRRARLVVAGSINDTKTTRILQSFVEEGGRLLRAVVETSAQPGAIPDDLPRMMPPGPEPELPDGLLPGLPAGFGRWTERFYRLPSSTSPAPAGYCLVLGSGAPSLVAANLQRFRPPPISSFADARVVAAALRIALLVAEDVLVLPEPRAAALAAAMSAFEGQALFRSVPSPMVVVRAIAETCGIPTVLASQIYEASVAVAAAGVDIDETERTRWGMSPRDLFPLIRSSPERVVSLDTGIVIVDLGSRVAVNETILVLSRPKSFVTLHRGEPTSITVYPAVIPDPNQRGGDLPALLVVRSSSRSASQGFEELMRLLHEHAGELVEVRYQKLSDQLTVLDVNPVRVHALEPQLKSAIAGLERLAGGGWFERAAEVGVRIQLVVLPKGEGQKKKGATTSSKPTSSKPKRNKGKGRRNG